MFHTTCFTPKTTRLLPYGPLAGGSLSGKYLNGANPEGSRNQRFPGMFLEHTARVLYAHASPPLPPTLPTTAFQPRYFSPEALAAVEEYAALAKSKNLTPTQLALAWCKSRWYVTSTIIGATKMSQLEENIAAFAIDLDEETLATIDAIHRRHRNPNVQD